MRKVITTLTVFVSLCALVSGLNVTRAQQCNVVFESMYYTDLNSGGLRGHDMVPVESEEAMLHICGSNGCPQGFGCLVRGAMYPFQEGTEYGLTHGAHCRDLTSYCCSGTGGACRAGVINCCNTQDECYNPNSDEFGQCQTCAYEDETCVEDSDCCTSLQGDPLICGNPNYDSAETGSRVCLNRPNPPSNNCAGLIDNGQVCDVDWWLGDNGRCSLCASGQSQVNAEGNGVCVGLPNGTSVVGIPECACASGIIDGGECVAGGCISDIGATCYGGGNCCDVINGSPVGCDGTHCVYTCSPVPEGTPCTSLSDCCTGSTGLVCYGGGCVPQGSVGVSCLGVGSCGKAAGCDYGQLCSSGRCVPSDDCIVSLDVKEYQGPIVTFNDLLSRIYSLLYPIGIALGLFFIAKAGYTIMMSEGNPTKISQGKEELTSAVLGTLFILLSLVILRVIIRALLGATI